MAPRNILCVYTTDWPQLVDHCNLCNRFRRLMILLRDDVRVNRPVVRALEARQNPDELLLDELVRLRDQGSQG